MKDQLKGILHANRTRSRRFETTSSTDTDDDPTLVIAKIKDNQNAIEWLYEFVAGERPFGTSFVKELHVLLTEHQQTYTGLDTLGNAVSRELPRGKWKCIENFVEHADGTRFEYCPFTRVSEEMERLVSLHYDHLEQSIPPQISAAWLHHRFTRIHPFVDGNGRVARCLATMVLLRSRWFPPVVTRRDRDDYIVALRAADTGDLRPLVDFFSKLQRLAVRKALSLSERVIHESTAVASVLSAVKEKFGERRKAEHDRRRNAAKTADSLQLFTSDRLEELAQEIETVIAGEDHRFGAYSTSGLRETETAGYFYQQIVEGARNLGYYANLNSYKSWTSLTIKTSIRCVLLFSFHGIGHQSAGILGCSAVLFTKESGETDDGNDRTFGELFPLCESPFDFAYTEDATDVQRRFQHWYDEVVVTGLQRWRELV